MRLFYSKEKPTTSSQYGSKNMKKKCFSEKTYLQGDFCLGGSC